MASEKVSETESQQCKTPATAARKTKPMQSQHVLVKATLEKTKKGTTSDRNERISFRRSEQTKKERKERKVCKLKDGKRSRHERTSAAAIDRRGSGRTPATASRRLSYP